MNKLLSKLVQELDNLRRSAALRKAQRRDRDAFMQLVWREDRTLTDAGYSREDINWAVNLPLSQNAALALKQRAATPQRNVSPQCPVSETSRQPGRLAVARHSC